MASGEDWREPVRESDGEDERQGVETTDVVLVENNGQRSDQWEEDARILTRISQRARSSSELVRELRDWERGVGAYARGEGASTSGNEEGLLGLNDIGVAEVNYMIPVEGESGVMILDSS